MPETWFTTADVALARERLAANRYGGGEDMFDLDDEDITEIIQIVLTATWQRAITEGRRQAAVAIRAQAPATSVIEGGPDLMTWAAELAECPRCPLGICSAHRPAGGVSDVH